MRAFHAQPGAAADRLRRPLSYNVGSLEKKLIESSHPPCELQAQNKSRLAYLRSNAFVGFLLSLASLFSSFLAFVPPISFIFLTLASGFFAYLTWTREAMKPHLGWLVPFVVGGAIWFSIDLSFSIPKALGISQFIAGIATGMFGCFASERLCGVKRE